MAIEVFSGFLGWMLAINIGFLVLTSVIVFAFKGLVRDVQIRMLGVDAKTIDTGTYLFFGGTEASDHRVQSHTLSRASLGVVRKNPGLGDGQRIGEQVKFHRAPPCSDDLNWVHQPEDGMAVFHFSPVSFRSSQVIKTTLKEHTVSH